MMRVGIGYDIHRVQPGGTLVLGGVRFDTDFGLEGHSDADVAIHALMDALLGAAALGDIGRHFPPSDSRFRGASSLDLLRRVGQMLSDEGWTVVNADVMVIAERPRLAESIPEMRRRVAEALGASPAAISMKATTNEGVGPEGRLEAVSAHAVAAIESIQ